MRTAINALIGVLSIASIYANAATDIKTTYYITQSSAESKTVLKGDSSKDNLMKGYLLDSLKKAFLNSAYITGIQETKGTETKEEYQGLGFTTMIKKSHVFVNVSLPEKVSLMFAVEQKYQACKAQASTNPDSISSCYLSSSTTLRGPLAVYGNYASPIDVNNLLKNKQELNFEMTRSYDGSEVMFNSRFTINSNNFEERLMKFMEVFHVPVPVAGEIGAGGAKLGSASLMTRQRMLVGIARYLRQGNEGVLK